ncbi:hypothetical protein [Streptomyces sp. NPDC021096]|uniref:hypothetical protein n=1 Tax=Streptomyces sp. NPDC021096 TaxID=3154792 RepID=UPI0033FEADC5
MLSRTITAGAVGFAAAAVSLIGMTPAVAASSAATAGSSWSASHGTATVEGTSRTERGAGGISTAYEGALKNTGGDCYSSYFVIQQDLAPGPPIKFATQCGVGTKPANFKVGALMPTTTVSVFVCKGDGFNDCGQRKMVR